MLNQVTGECLTEVYVLKLTELKSQSVSNGNMLNIFSQLFLFL